MATPQTKQVQCPAAVFELGAWLATRRPWGILSEGLSAEDAECLQHIRDAHLYKSKSASWSEFCLHYLGASKARINREIQCLEEFGPSYFALNRVAAVKPEQFRAIAHHISGASLVTEGGPIPLAPGNERLIRAVLADLLRRESPPAETAPSAFALVEQRFSELIGLIASLEPPLEPRQRKSLAALLARLCDAVETVGATRRAG